MIRQQSLAQQGHPSPHCSQDLDYSFPKEMVSLTAQGCRHYDRVPEDSVVEIGGVGGRGQAGILFGG